MALGAMLQWPLSGDPKRAAKQAAESNRGKHRQSIDPLRPTRAAVALLPMSAWSSISRAIKLDTEILRHEPIRSDLLKTFSVTQARFIRSACGNRRIRGLRCSPLGRLRGERNRQRNLLLLS